MQYPMMVPPFEFDSFEGLTKAQAQQLFDWYVSCIPERVELLDECFNSVWHCNIRFDYSLASLGPLWAAFEKHIRTEKKSERQIRAESRGAPEHVMEELLEDRRDLTKGTYIIAMDIAMYFGEVLARNLPGIHWGFFTKPRKLASVNRPVLLGFSGNDYMEPEQIILVGCWKSIDRRNPRFLSEVVEVWRGYLPGE